MRMMRFVPMGLSVLALSACLLPVAQAGGGEWHKSYPIAGKASLTISAGDASIEIRSCGSCREVQIRVDWKNRQPSDFSLTEFKTGDHVTFELKDKPRLGIHFGSTNWHSPQITVDSPSQLDLEAKTSDGSVKISGVQGNLHLSTSDGSVDGENLAGSLRLSTSDGSIHLHNVTGTLESHSSNGSATIDGQFSALQVRASDGSLNLTMNNGSQLTAASSIETSDGSVHLRLPRSLAASLDVRSSDGQVKCSLPLTMENYESPGGGSSHHLRGRLNAGSTPLTIRTSDGSVQIDAL